LHLVLILFQINILIILIIFLICNLLVKINLQIWLGIVIWLLAVIAVLINQISIILIHWLISSFIYEIIEIIIFNSFFRVHENLLCILGCILNIISFTINNIFLLLLIFKILLIILILSDVFYKKIVYCYSFLIFIILNNIIYSINV